MTQLIFSLFAHLAESADEIGKIESTVTVKPSAVTTLTEKAEKDLTEKATGRQKVSYKYLPFKTKKRIQKDDEGTCSCCWRQKTAAEQAAASQTADQAAVSQSDDPIINAVTLENSSLEVTRKTLAKEGEEG